MTQVKEGDRVCVHYRGTLDDGTEFDSTFERKPLDFTLGQGEVLPGFDAAVHGMQKGEEKTITVAPDEAYGPHRPQLVADVPRSSIPSSVEPRIGMRLKLKSKGGEIIVASVTAITDEMLTLDSNHPLAGQKLTFAITLIEIYPELPRLKE